MTKKSNLPVRVEPAQLMPEDYKAAIERIVNERIAALQADKEAAELEPFFRGREITNEMRRLQSVAEQNKWHFFFADWGCLICERTNVPHASLGMCKRCFGRTKYRLKTSRENREDKTAPEVGYRDTMRLAREALLPSVEKLSRKRRGQ